MAVGHCKGCGVPVGKPGPGRYRHFCAACNPEVALHDTCKKCGTHFEQKRIRGKPFSLCEKCRTVPKYSLAARQDRPCGTCGKVFSALSRHKYCSRKCLKKAKTLTAQAKIPPRKCAECGAEFFTWQTKRMKYCSQKCQDAVALRVWSVNRAANIARYREAEKAKLVPRQCMVCGGSVGAMQRMCSVCALARKAARKEALKIAARVLHRRELSCKCCGVLFCPVPGTYTHAFCSDECRNAVTKAREKKNRKEARRAGKHSGRSNVQRAKKFGVERKHFNELRILERDGWRCKVCGVRTPQRLRGTHDERAPEVGHIIALAEGGRHVPENVQCECRACNARKGSRALGQLMLEGFGHYRKSAGRSKSRSPKPGNHALASEKLNRDSPRGQIGNG